VNGTNGRLFVATRKQLMDYEVILTNDRGDELWRFCNGADGKPQWKVWAVEPTQRTIIRNWQSTVIGATYYQTGRHIARGQKFIGCDYIIPRKYFRRVANLLDLRLRRDTSPPPTLKQLQHRQKFTRAAKIYRGIVRTIEHAK